MKRVSKKTLLLLLAVILFPVFIFEGSYYVQKELKAVKTIKIINFGDVMFDRGVRNIIENKGRDPFEYIKESNIFKNFDFVIANLEGPIVEMDRSLCQQKAYNFQFGGDTVFRLKSMGINIVNIANNHSYDCFEKGFESTKKYLSTEGVDYMGDRPVDKSFIIKEINGKKIAFAGIDETVRMIPLEEFYPLIKKLKSENDYVIVNIHWGMEYNLGFTQTQQNIGHKLIDSGADVVFGHHPHVVEPVEVYKNGVIFYSLGNFVFDQGFGDTSVGLGASVEFNGNKNNLKKVFEIFPFNIKQFAPDFMVGEERDKFCDKFLKSLNNKDCRFETE